MMPETINKDQVENVVNSLRLIACPHPLSIERDRIDCYVPEGATIAEHLRAKGFTPDSLTALVYLDEQLVLSGEWEYAVPTAGQCLSVRVIPLDSGGGGGKTALRIVAMIGVVVAAAMTGQAEFLAAIGPWAGPLASATITIAGTLAINALIPPSRMLSDGGLTAAGAENPSFSLTGTRNQLLPYGVVPQVLGYHKIFPLYAATPYTEIVGNDQYLRCLFTCGLGPLALSDLKIGTTPIENFTDVQLELRAGYATDAPITLDLDDVNEKGLSILLTQAGGRQVRRSQANARELSVDIAIQGLVEYDASGNPQPRTVQVEIAYRPAAGGAWTVVDNTPAVAATLSMQGLVFTARTAGFNGNNVMVNANFTDEYASVSATLGAWGVSSFIEVVGPIGTTAAEVRAAIEAHGGANGLVSVSTVAGGTIWISEGQHLSGGSDAITSLQATESSPQLQRRGLRWPVPAAGEYEIGLTRLTADTTSTSIRDQIYWTALRTIQRGLPTTLTGQCLIAMRIRSSNQLNGLIDELNVFARSLVKDWAGSAWVERPSNNPASLVRHVLQGGANAKPKPDARLDLTTLQGFHARCVANGFTFNAVIDRQVTVRQLTQDILAAGRGTFGFRDMQYSVVEDLPQTIPVQILTPRNAWDLQGEKLFLEFPHGRKVRFKNEAKDFADDERILPLDGYGVTGVDGVRRDAFGLVTSNPEATIFETVDAGVGITNDEQVWTLERYHQAVAYHRSETFRMSQDIEQLRCTRGDRVEVNYDVLLVGLGAARVKSVTVDGSGNALSVTVDDSLTMESGKTYGARFRKSSGTQTVAMLTTVVGEQHTFTFTSPIPSADKPTSGDLVAFGEYGQETMPCIVKQIQAGADFSGRLTLLPYAPAVQTAASGTIPAFQSYLTLPSSARAAVAAPLLSSILSDETVLVRQSDGAFDSRIVITVAFASGTALRAAFLQVQFRRTGSSDAWTTLSTPVSVASVTVSIAPVETGLAYDVRLRSVSGGSQPGLTSDWLTILNHTVIGTSTRPPDVASMILEGRLLRWTYPLPPPDMAGFVVRRQSEASTNWDPAIPLHDGVVTDNRFLVPVQAGRVTYLVKAIDVAGNQSVHVAAATYDFGVLSYQTEFGDEIPMNLILSTDMKAAGFPGTVVNGTVSGGNLVADSDGTPLWTGDDLPIWTRDSDLWWTGQYKAMTYTFTVLPDSDKLDAILSLAATIQGQAWTIEYHPDSQSAWWTDDLDPMWTDDAAAMWDANLAWFLWSGSLINLTRQTYTFRITIDAGYTQGVIWALLIKFDVHDIEETLSNIAISAAGTTRLPITKTYRAIEEVHLSLVDDAGVAQWVKSFRPYDPSGPLVKAWDGTSTLTTAHVDARVKGY